MFWFMIGFVSGAATIIVLLLIVKWCASELHKMDYI